MIPPLPVREYFQRLPTTDLYLLNPLRAVRQTSQQTGRLPPIRCLAANVYAIGRTGVIVRYGDGGDLDRLKRAGVRRIVYVVDDDFQAGAEDPHLPPHYRRRLAAFAEGGWPLLRDAADVVVVPGAVLAALYGERARIHPPAWAKRPADTGHFERPGPTEIVHLGTGSHIADLTALAPTLAETLSAHPATRLTLFSGDSTPAPLRGHAQVRIRRPLSWWRYKRALTRLRAHLALYPLADSAFNRARSANKLYEHALVGAASLMAPNPALREAAGPGLSHLFVEGGPEDWARRIAEDLADRELLRVRAEMTRRHLELNDPLTRAVRGWLDILADEFS